jgi:hypothetical protein
MSERDKLADLLMRKAPPMHREFAEAFADIILGAGYRREQSAPETATPGENISAENQPANRTDAFGMKR